MNTEEEKYYLHTIIQLLFLDDQVERCQQKHKGQNERTIMYCEKL